MLATEVLRLCHRHSFSMTKRAGLVVLLLVACKGDVSGPGVTSVDVSPAAASLEAGTTVALTATPRDASGQPLSGHVVTWSSGAPTIAAVDGNGLVSAKATGQAIITATSEGRSGSAALTVNPGPPAALEFVVGPGSVIAGVAIDPAIEVRARDGLGNTATSFTGLVTIGLAANPGGANLSGTTSATAVAGVATFTNLVLDKSGNGYTLQASSGALSVAGSASFSVAGGSAARLAFLQLPSSATAGQAITPPVLVAAVDAFGNTATGFTGAVSIALGANPAGGTLTGTLSHNAVNGVATFADLSLDKAGSGYRVTASAAGLSDTTSSQFAVTAGSVFATQSTVAVSPATLTASNGASAATVTVTAKDAFGNPVPGVTVVLAASGTGNTVTQPAGPTDVNGVATGTLSSTAAGTKTVSATAGGVALPQTQDVTVNAAAASALAFAGQPSTTQAGAPIAPAVAVTAQDAFGNPVSSFAGQVTVAIGTNPAGGTLSGAKTKGATGGVATFSDLSIDKQGAGYTLTATASGLTTGTSSAFAITSSGVSATQSSVAVSPATITASTGTSATTVTVTAKDPFGNPVPGVTVVLAASGAGNTLTQPAGPTNVNGVATGTLSSTEAGTKTVSAVAGGVPLTQTQDVTVSAAAAKALAFTGQPSATQAGAPITPGVAVAAQDEFGNLVSSFVGQVTVAIGANPAGGTLSGVKVKNATSGVASYSDLSIDKQGVGYTLTATTSASGITGATSSPFAITAGGVSAAQSSVSVSPAVIAASTGGSVATITVTARDGFGNPVPGVTVTLAVSGTGNALTQPAGPTDGNGVATGSVSSTVAGTKTVSAMAGGVAITQTQSVTVNPGGATVLAFTAQPRDTAAGALINGPGGVKVTAQDAFGNTDNTFTATVALTLAANPGSGTLSGQLSRPGVAGVATFTDLSIDKTGQGFTLRAAASGVAPDTSSPFGISAGPVSPSQSTASASPTSIQASNGSSTSTITVTVKDALGNPVQGAAVVLAAAPAPGTTVTQPGPANAAGTTTGTLSATAIGPKTLTVTANGVQLSQQPAVTVTAGAVSASQTTVGVSSDTIEASSGGITTGVVVTAKDAFGNPIAGASVTVAAVGTGVSLTLPSGTTDVFGVFDGAAVSATTIGNVVVSATVAGVSITQKDTVVVVAGEVSASQSTLVASPATVAASSGSGGSTVTVTARDDLGNPIAGATVVLSASGSGNAVVQPAGPTNASGVAVGTLRSTVAEGKIVSATIAGTGLAQTDTVTVTPAAADTTAFVVQPSGATVGSTITPPVQVEIRDQFGNRVTTATNNVILTLSSNPGNATLTGGGPVAAVAGLATFAGISLDKVATGYRLAATATAVPKPGLSNTFNITSGQVSAAQTGVGVSPGSITASNGSSQSVITVTARDAGGSAVAGATVVLSASGSGNTVTQPSGPTDAGGVATGTISSTGAGSKTITAVVNGITITQQPSVTVIAGAISGSQSTILASPSAIVQTTGSATITVTAKDGFGNPVSGATVVLAATGMGNSLTQPALPTSGMGVATGSLSSSVLGNKVVTATAGGIALAQSDTVVVVAPGSSAVLVGAGDIAVCGKQDDEATAAVVSGVLATTPGAEVFTLGDNAYENGKLTEFNNCYNPSWGVFKSVTHPSAGNHDYNTSGAAGYYQYFGAAAGDSGKGYYSYDFGAWHVIVLNSEISTSANSPQLQWLQADLAAHPSVCTLAYFHQPLYSSVGGTPGTTGATISSVRTFWNALYAGGADLVLNGHRHVYERLARMAPDGSPDPTNGIREIVVGSGGDSGGDLTNIFPTSEVREGRTYGVIKLTLHQTSYDWQFLPAEGGTFTDSGSESCH
jgi:hypothetical protein